MLLLPSVIALSVPRCHFDCNFLCDRSFLDNFFFFFFFFFFFLLPFHISQPLSGALERLCSMIVAFAEYLYDFAPVPRL